EGAITNSYSAVDVTAQSMPSVGGLAGANDGVISGSFATGNVVGGNEATTGGLVGYGHSGTINNSYATGAVSGDIGAGGLVGDNIGAIGNSYSTGAATGGTGSDIGGPPR